MNPLDAFINEVGPRLAGDLHVDRLRRGVYATDASIYQVVPHAIVYPKSVEDVQLVIRHARESGLPALPRGGGTSLAGQTVAQAVVIDFTRYMHHVLEFNKDEHWIRVEPGITRDEVNAFVKTERLEFAPDPATSSRATIGGMIANNSSGTKSILYGKTSDHVIELTVLLTGGEILKLSPTDLTSAANADSGEGELLLRLNQIVEENREEILVRFPKTMRRVNGYALDALLQKDPWNPHQIFVGSEGTLGIILEAKIRLVPLPTHKGVSVVHFHSALEAVRAVTTMLGFEPAAVEILSGELIRYSRKNLATKNICGFVIGDPESIQIVEFYGENPDEIAARAEALHDALKAGSMGYAWDYYPEGEIYQNVWDIRKKGLGLLLGEPDDKRPLAFIEDAAIPVDVLPEYIEKVMGVCSKYGVKATYYAHASVGVIHVRPILDLREQGDIDKMQSIANEVFDLVMHYGGAWSGEHGDGLVRSPFLEKYFGNKIYNALKEVKLLFDPSGILNPGKIIEAPPMTQNLRYGSGYRDTPLETIYRYPEQRNFHTAVHQCSGLGACRKMEGGTMCPSFMVTRDELHTTRGRANALRLAMSGQLGDKGLANPELLDALDLCLSCKACKAECPSSVDMARLKSEVLQIQYNNNGSSLRDRMVRDSAPMARKLAGVAAAMVNSIQSSGIFRSAMQSIVHFDRRRTLPKYATKTFTTWFSKYYRDKGLPRRIGLFADTYMNYHEPEIGKSSVKLLQALGWDVDLLTGCCQRPRISHGFLEVAKKDAAEMCNDIANYPGNIVICEPGCASAFTDDLPDLLEDMRVADSIKTKVVPMEIWLAEQIASQASGVIRSKFNKILLHGHCHQKALYGTNSLHRIFNAAGAEVIEPDSGCCGMAGSFGYEKEHYDISEKLYNRVLGKAINDNPDLPVVASGFSCRHQIAHFSKRKPLHWLEALTPE